MKDYRIIRTLDIQMSALTDEQIDNAYVGILDDGTIEGHAVETYYKPIERLWLDESGILHIAGDDGPFDFEVRLLPETLRNFGFVRDPDHDEHEPIKDPV